MLDAGETVDPVMFRSLNTRCEERLAGRATIVDLHVKEKDSQQATLGSAIILKL